MEVDGEPVAVRRGHAGERTERREVPRVFHTAQLRLRGAQPSRRRPLRKTCRPPQFGDGLSHRGRERIGALGLFGGRCYRGWCRLFGHGAHILERHFIAGETEAKPDI